MNQQRREAFNKVASLYDIARPSYPPALVEDVIKLAGLVNSSKILEIGAGTGKATILFADKVYTIHCLEPGGNLAKVAAENLLSFSNITIETITFEDWELQASAFNLVMSAQAIHWIPAEVAYPKIAKALKKTGRLALFWNLSPNPDSEVYRQLNEVHRFYAEWRLKPIEQQRQEREHELLESGFFKNFVTKEYSWSMRYSVQQYLNLLNTQSDFLILPQAVQQQLAHRTEAILNKHGGYIVKPYLTLLLVAQPI